ncbi:phospholipase D-like domain-containing protein [Nonomuraea sp. NPDC004297]
MTDHIVLGGNVVPGGFFLLRRGASTRTPFVPEEPGKGTQYRHCFTYAGGGSTIRRELIDMINSARHKIFIGTLVLGDAELREALVRAAKRLCGGVYIVSSLDDKGLEKAIKEGTDTDDIDAQLEYRNFTELTRHGVYVRGLPGLHAKFVVVDDEIALVSSANLVTGALDRVGENGVVVTAPADVRTLARLFTRLWRLSRWDMPPDPAWHSVNSRKVRSRKGDAEVEPVLLPGGPAHPIWTWDRDHHIAATLGEVIGRATQDAVLATFSIACMTAPLPGREAHPDLLFDPVRQALARGVRVRLLMRGRNNMPAARAEATAFAEAGAEILPDRLNHAKGVIADGRWGALFSANFLPDQGLTGGIEVGMRLDGTPALGEARRYFEHVMAEASMRFARDPHLAELASHLYAESLSPWPLPPEIALTCEDLEWDRLRELDGVVLYQREDDRRVTLYGGGTAWTVEGRDDRWHVVAAHPQPGGAAELFEAWLTARRPSEQPKDHGVCPATLIRAS